MQYDQALDYVLGLTNYEQTSKYAYSPENFDLRRVEQLLSKLDNPHRSAGSIHVAGTKGKGSTSAMVASILRTAGFKTGLFTSPHLHTFRERIQVDGKLIEKQELADLVAEMYPFSEEVQMSADYGQLTTFELATVIAFMHFRKERVDFQVLETGLGGRLDATNVVTPMVSVITSISLDHTAILGETLAAISGEKAGIIKMGVPVVSSFQVQEAFDVIADKADAKGSRLTQLGRDLTVHSQGKDETGQAFSVKTSRNEYNLTLPLLGEYQQENAATAIAAIEVVKEAGFTIQAEQIEKGIRQVVWPGRLQVLRRNPTVVVDGAHNSYSTMKLREALDHFFKFDQFYLVLGTSYDKDIPGIIREISRNCRLAVVVRSKHPRSTDPRILAETLADFDVPSIEAPDVSTGIAMATAMAKQTDLICVTGSLFVVSEAIEALETVEMD